MAVRSQENGIPHKRIIGGVVSMVGGASIAAVGLLDFMQSVQRVNGPVNQEYPRIFTPEQIQEAKQTIEEFNTNVHTSVRRGDLMINIPPEVSQRVNLAFGTIDQETDRNKERESFRQQLTDEEYAFDLDPSNFKVGRAIVSYSSSWMGIVGAFIGASTFLRTKKK